MAFPFSSEQLDETIDRVYANGLIWQETPFPERSLRAQDAGRAHQGSSRSTCHLDHPRDGQADQPIKGGVREKCAWLCEYFADHAQDFLADRAMTLDDQKAMVTFRPIGTIYAVMPWNFPLWQVFRSVAPTIMAGNSVVLKHAPCVFGCGEAIESLFRDAGFPRDLLRSIVIDTELSEQAINHDAVRGVTLTGSCRTGRIVASQAGAALKKSVMELGGSDPYVVLDDADLDLAVEKIMTARMLANGQVCISAKRLIVTPGIVDRFTRMLVDSMSTYEMEDPRGILPPGSPGERGLEG